MQTAPELVALLQRYYVASAQGDTAFLDLLIARHPGTLVVGTDAAEWWRGGEQIVQTWSAAWQQRGGMPVQDSQPEAFRAGDVGWVADQARWRLPDGRTVPFRLTAVFHRDGGDWLMVQAHFRPDHQPISAIAMEYRDQPGGHRGRQHPDIATQPIASASLSLHRRATALPGRRHLLAAPASAPVTSVPGCLAISRSKKRVADARWAGRPR